MSKHNLQIEKETFKIGLKAKFLTYNVITLPPPLAKTFG